MLSSKLKALCFSTEIATLNMVLNQSSGCKGGVQEERGELPPAINNNRHICLFVLAVINIAATYQETANIPSRQKNYFFSLYERCAEFHLSIFTGMGLQI